MGGEPTTAIAISVRSRAAASGAPPLPSGAPPGGVSRRAAGRTHGSDCRMRTRARGARAASYAAFPWRPGAAVSCGDVPAA